MTEMKLESVVHLVDKYMRSLKCLFTFPKEYFWCECVTVFDDGLPVFTVPAVKLYASEKNINAEAFWNSICEVV